MYSTFSTILKATSHLWWPTQQQSSRMGHSRPFVICVVLPGCGPLAIVEGLLCPSKTVRNRRPEWTAPCHISVRQQRCWTGLTQRLRGQQGIRRPGQHRRPGEDLLPVTFTWSLRGLAWSLSCRRGGRGRGRGGRGERGHGGRGGCLGVTLLFEANGRGARVHCISATGRVALRGGFVEYTWRTDTIFCGRAWKIREHFVNYMRSCDHTRQESGVTWFQCHLPEVLVAALALLGGLSSSIWRSSCSAISPELLSSSLCLSSLPTAVFISGITLRVTYEQAKPTSCSSAVRVR